MCGRRLSGHGCPFNTCPVLREGNQPLAEKRGGQVPFVGEKKLLVMKAPLLVEQKKGGCRHKEDKTDQSQVVLRSCAERGLFWREKKLVCGRPCSLHNVPNLQDFRGSSDFRHFVFGVLNNARGTTVSGEQKKGIHKFTSVCGRPCSQHNVPNLRDFRGSSDSLTFGILCLAS